jgi:hypothetical protein
LKTEVAYIGLFLVLAGVGMLVPIGLPLHTQRIHADLAPDEILLDLHVHTSRSDGHLSPAARVDWYLAQGVSVAAFSDHGNYYGATDAQAYVEARGLDFTVLVAQEFTNDWEDIHLNVYGLEEILVPAGTPLPGDHPVLNTQDMIAYAKARGAFVTVNHPGSSPDWEDLRDWGVDGFEIVNEARDYPAVRQFCLDNDLICMQGSDVHTNGPLPSFTRLHLDDPTNRTLDAIFDALKRNEHEIVVIGSPDVADLGDSTLNAWCAYFETLTTPQLVSWWIWAVGACLLVLKVEQWFAGADAGLIRLEESI